ncbi:MAG: preprotein translocase subunit YajC [Candidatus Egerieousia sp.]|jgi:preprotein translocase subunit YajC|nr:preprotein translocase subunit YajC [Bacteroidales bacterium]MDY2649677.1 preprotein translocase subunit YajC [Candidatus Egerieousia sp.]MDY3293836.1 preprotein translocase subunit YajC [Candidatus Egerieousia sp.]MDY5023967.1 preprotein translocase subunit YajC [Candidatus Egerieousia sp.]MDY5254983.1 preprotein translocase subunit YajC [Candidatus Egerieousia sp.]
MVFMTFLQETAAQPAAGGNMSFLIMMLLIFVVMYFFMIRPQQKKQKEIAKFRNELKKGDKIVTIGGIYGTVDEIREKYVIIVVDGDVKLRVDKSAIVKDMSDVPAK